MGSQLRVRPAESTADLHAVADVASAAFGLPGPAWIARAKRLGSARRADARPWLLEAGGRPVATLLAYPLSLVMPDGTVAPAFGYGAVATLPAEQRQGHAAHLCRVVAERQAEEGRRVGLLFSGIPTAYYERLGWRCVPAHAHVTSGVAELAATGSPDAWHAIDPRRMRARLAALYDASHRGTLHQRRDEAGWRRTLEVSPTDLWLGLGRVDGALRGYARVSVDETALDVAELVLADPDEQAAALGGLAALAHAQELERMRTWLEPSPAVERWLVPGDRSKTQPMVLGLEPPERALLWWPDYF